MKSIVLQTSGAGSNYFSRAAEKLNIPVNLVRMVGDVLEFVTAHKNEPVFVISSDYIDDDACYNADKLAEKLKKTNPQVIVFTFSSSPDSNKHVTAEIPKGGINTYERAVAVVQHVEQSGYDRDAISANFPEIKFFR